ncbi:RagB/SusD family nutrient uptake outer membrane protein [Mucilaginibacter ginsenosidivorax]|uniref:RagB/SusD family nutrient uptake outer membrane protein n=1 Tax=Mucilaginibacter ginsenosidivorax TaxID=862126 RepID=A0A5B8W546_9SPHI|nr:RagB/SusD family nutrient uptake outer membrane protein [Mucilaginibacter ginsenosidivorax]QEC78873.1 RagB/SusD family nutrient uptake outer membrane protein [Mucilaginibacter ginsenosidivorax]
MKNIIYLLSVLIASLLFTGCNKFLEEQSQDLAYANTWQKLDEVMQGDVYMRHFTNPPSNSYKESPDAMYFPWLNAMDDDITEFVSRPYYIDNRDDVFGFYTWQANPFVDKTYHPFTDDTWSKVYKSINAANIMIYQADQLHDNPTQLRRIKGEALFLRAFYYFYMVNVYASAYNPATAKTDMGVPLKITEFVQDKFFTRSTVDSVYQQMLTDLNASEQYLGGVTQSSLYHVDVNAVNLLQSRVYLYMQSWANAIAAADKVIARKPALFNLSTYKPQTSFFSGSNPEALFTQGGNAMVYLMGDAFTKSFQASPSLINLYEANDLRRSAFFETDAAGKIRYTKMYRSRTYNIFPTEMFSDNYYLRNAEAYLNKAEAAAMLDRAADADNALNTLRQARFIPSAFVPVNYSGEQLVSFIRDERRRELCFEGHRWFDLKRYAVNKAFPFITTIVHNYSDVNYGSSPFLKASLTLQPGDPDYLIPIPQDAIIFNEGALKQNPARQNRTF